MQIYKKIVCFLLAVILAGGCMVQLSIPVAAAHENTHVNTGNQIEDIIAVAMTQVGYKEYGPNYTKYGQWWGYNPMAWCAVFVSWCADQAGIPESVMKQSSFANPGSFGLTDTFYASQRTPKRGDLMFKTNGGHVALIYQVSGSKFYTIEGNTYTYADPQEGVMLRERNLYDSGYYFATPRYNSTSGSPNSGSATKPVTPPSCSHTYVKGAETEHPHKEYYQCSRCSDKYYTGTEKTVDTCKTCQQENCSHRYETWKKQDETYHGSVCSLCDLEKKEAHSWGSDEVLLEPTCIDPGTKKQICEICNAERETEIPPTDEHTFGSYILIDSEIHAMICEVCEKREESPHTMDGGWSASATDHWLECPDCRGRINIGKHSIYGSCGTACSICDIVPNTGHMYYAKWTSNAKSHWHRCSNCAASQKESPHIYSAECDESCDECGYIRHVVHSYGTTWESDAAGHWKLCQKCGQIKEMQSHIPGSQATENRAQVCTVCKTEIVPIQQHTHKYAYRSDDKSHWGVCACGVQMAAEVHSWQLSDGKCEICRAEQTAVDTSPVILGIKLPNVMKTQWAWGIIMICFGGIIVLIVLAILFASLRRMLMAGTAAKLRREFDEEDDDWDEEIPVDAPKPTDVPVVPPVPLMDEEMPMEAENPAPAECLEPESGAMEPLSPETEAEPLPQ